MVASVKTYFVTLLICISVCSLIFIALFPQSPNYNASSPSNTAETVIMEEEEEAIPAIFKKRREILSRGCKKRFGFSASRRTVMPSYLKKASFNLLFVNDNYRVLFCGVPKAASTNWRKLFLIASSPSGTNATIFDTVDVHAANSFLRPLYSYSKEQLKTIFHNYTKIAFVRNPISRLLSAWSSKLSQPNPVYPKLFGSDIIRKFRQGATKDEIEKGQPVRLEEFFRFLLNRGSSDPHWAPQYNLCEVCIIPYNFIGNYETLQQDASFIMEHVLKKTGGVVLFPKAGNTTSSMTRVDYLDHLKKVPRDLIKQIVANNAIDFQLFGYDNNITSYLL